MTASGPKSSKAGRQKGVGEDSKEANSGALVDTAEGKEPVGSQPPAHQQEEVEQASMQEVQPHSCRILGVRRHKDAGPDVAEGLPFPFPVKGVAVLTEVLADVLEVLVA